MLIDHTPAAAYRCFEGRSDGWSAHAEGEFLRVLSESGNVSAAARCVAMSLSSVYARRHDARRRGFAIAWEAALVLARDRLFDNIFERAIDGERFTTVKDGAETTYHRPNYRLGLGFLKHLDEKPPSREAKWVASHFEEWLDTLAVGQDRALRETIAPYEYEDPWLGPWARKTFPLAEDSAKNEAPDDEESAPVWFAGGRWLTGFPAAEDFDGEVIEGEPGRRGYCRTLSSAEAAIMRQSKEAFDAEMRAEEAEALAHAVTQRDAYFARLLEPPVEDEFDDDWSDEAPIEYKSMDAPRPSGGVAFSVHAEARRRGGSAKATKFAPSPLRVSASPRESSPAQRAKRLPARRVSL